jgi:hypothetical protein
MRRRGYTITRYADDWVATCRTKAEAKAVLAQARRILQQLGVELNLEKTRIVHVTWGFEFLGFKIKQGTQRMQLQAARIKTNARQNMVYAYPRNKSVQHFKDEIRQRTKRRLSRTTAEIIQLINPVIRGWGLYFCKAHVRKMFNKLDRWIVRRIRSHKHKRWRNAGWIDLPESLLYGQLELVKLIGLIPSLAPRYRSSVKAGCGKTARPV